LPPCKKALPNCKIESDFETKTTATEKSNYALEFDGKTSYVQLPPLNRDLRQPITLELTVISQPPVSSNSTSSWPLITGISSWGLKWRHESYTAVFRTHDEKAPYIHGISTPKLNVKTHVAAVWDGSVYRLFVNGVEEGQLLRIPNPSQNPKYTTFQIGGHGDFSNPSNKETFFHGILDEVRISNIARYTKDFTPAKRFTTDKNTMALYHFDEGSGDVLKDASGNGHDGKIVGAKWVKVDDELKVVKPTTTGDTPMTDREVAEWVIGMGGKVVISNMELTNLKQLPTEPFVIEQVRLQNTSLKDDDLNCLTGLKSLNRLNIKDTLISDTGLQYLKDIPLNHLVLSNTQITDKGLGYLSNMPSLTILYVSETAISNAGVERLKDMIQLDILFLANTQIDDIGLGHLAGLTNLRQLYMNNTRITDSGLKHLKGMKQLQTLGLGATSITNAGLKELTGLKISKGWISQTVSSLIPALCISKT